MNWRLTQPLLIFCLLFIRCTAHADNAPPAGPPPSAPVPVAADAVPAALPLPPTGSAGSRVPVPTDLTPPDAALPIPIPLGQSLLISGALDGRYRTATVGRSRQIWLNAAEMDLDRPFTHQGNPIGDVHVQIIAENPPDIPHAQDLQLGEAYAIYKLPFQTQTDSTVYLKVGQFQLPFGLLAVYDPHLQLLQPLYQQSLGLRTDFGMEVSGRYYGFLNYDFSLTTGKGPDRIDITKKSVVVFRLGRTFITRNGVVNVGGSLLQGTLPSTDISAAHPFAFELPPSGYARSNRGYVAKTRIAGDGTIIYKSLTGRGEAMLGADNNSRVLGYYAEVDYRFSPRAVVVAAHSAWDYPQANSVTDRSDIGLTYSLDTNLTFRVLYESLYDVPVGAPASTDHMFTVQTLLRF